MKARARFGDIFGSLTDSLRAVPEAAELASQLRQLSREIRALSPDPPLVGGIETALRMTDGARSAAAPLVSLAAEMVADHAPDSGWSRQDLQDYLAGLGPTRAAEFLDETAAAIGSGM